MIRPPLIMAVGLMLSGCGGQEGAVTVPYPDACGYGMGEVCLTRGLTRRVHDIRSLRDYHATRLQFSLSDEGAISRFEVTDSSATWASSDAQCLSASRGDLRRCGGEQVYFLGRAWAEGDQSGTAVTIVRRLSGSYSARDVAAGVLPCAIFEPGVRRCSQDLPVCRVGSSHDFCS